MVMSGVTSFQGETARDSAEIVKNEKVIEILDRVEKEGISWITCCRECSKNALVVCNNQRN